MSTEPDMAAADRYGNWVLGQMRIKGWNQARLAAETGMSPSIIASIRNGTALRPSPDHIARIADAFDTDPNEIFRMAGWWRGDAPAEELSSLERELVSTLRRLPRDRQQIALKQIRALVEGES